MKKRIAVTVLMLCLGLALLSAGAAEPEGQYDTVVTVEGSTVESLQAAMDGLPGNAGDVQINIESTLFSGVDELDLSVPTDKAITSLTLSRAPSATDTVCVYTSGYGENTMRFFANGVPVTIDDGVHFGPLPTTWPQGAAQLFGGSKNADLAGNTGITVNAGGAANAAIYGGGLNGRVDGDVSITVRGAYGTIHGGGCVAAAADSGDLCADVTGKVVIVVDSEVTPEYEAYRTHTWYNSHIYGGGRISTGFADFAGARAFSAQVGRGVSIEVNTLMNQATVFGGGQVASQCTGGDVTLNADVTGNVDIRVGGRTQLIEDCVAPRSPLSVVGGGYVWRQNSDCSDRATARVHGAVTVTAVDNDAAASGAGGINSIIGGGVTENGGANSDVTVNGDVTVETSRKTLPFKAVGGVYHNVGVAGGGYSSGGTANVAGDVNIHIRKAPGQSADYANVKNVVGGGVTNGAGAANVDGNVTVRIDEDMKFDAGTIEGIGQVGIVGGGWSRGQNGTANVTGAVTTAVGKGAVLSGPCHIVGGGWVTGWYSTANVTGSVSTTIGENAVLDGDCRVVGGGWAPDWYGTATVTASEGQTAVTTTIGDGATFRGLYHIVGGGWAGNGGDTADGPYGAVTTVTGDVKTRVGAHVTFAGSVPDGSAETEPGLVGGGLASMWGGNADVAGTVTTTVADAAAFSGTGYITGGGRVAGPSGAANVARAVTTGLGANARFAPSGAYRVVGGGWVAKDSGSATVGGPVTTTVGANAVFDGDYKLIGGSGIAGCWYGRGGVTGPVTTTVGPGAVFNGNCLLIGGGWGGDYDDNVTVTGGVTTTVGDGAAFNGAYRIVGGGWAGSLDVTWGGVAHVEGNVETRIGKNASFAGGYLPGQDGNADGKAGLVGGGWLNKSYEGTAGAKVTGTVTTLIGENAAFQSPCWIVGGGAKDSGLHQDASAATGPISLTLNGTAEGGDLEELFLGSLEGRSASASAVVTLQNTRVGYLYDKDGYCPEPITVNFLGSSQAGWVFFQGHGNGDEASAKVYRLNVGDGAAPAELTVTGYLTYSYPMPWERLDIRIFDGATLKSGSAGKLIQYYMHSLTLDEGGTLVLYDVEGANSSITGGGTLELMTPGARLNMTDSAATFTGTVTVKAASPAAGQVVATTVQTGAQGIFVYDGDDFYIRKAPNAGGNYDWALATLTPPTAATGLAYTGEPQSLLSAAGSGQDGDAMRYSLDGETYFDDIADVTATDAGTYTVYYRMFRPDAGEPLDKPRSVAVAVAKAQNAIADLSCPDIACGQTPSPNANATFGTITYQYAPAPDGPFGEWDTANACGAWYVKATVAGTDNYDGAEAVTDFWVTALPQDTPSITVDFAAETLTGFVPGGRYTVGGAEVTPDENGALPAGPYLGQNVAIVKLGDGVSTADSPAQTLPVPARPGVPEGVTAVAETVLGKGDGRLTGLTSDMEYSPGGQAPWTQCPDGELPWAVGADVYVRMRATETAFAGEILPLRLAAGQPLTVTFETGEDAAPAPAELAYNTTLTAPEEPQREGYAFGGWFRDGEYTQPWDFENDRVTESLTLYAQWIALHTHVWAPAWDSDDAHHWHPCAASGCDLAEPIQMDGYGPHSPDPGTITTHATLDAPGERTFRCTECQTVLGTEPIPQLSAAGSNVVVTPGAPGITVDQPRLDAVAEAERPAGGNVTVTLTVCLADDPRYHDAVAAIAALAGEQSVEYMDLTLTKETVDADGHTETTAITDTNGRVLEIAVDFDFTGKRNVTVYRHHGGGAETLAQDDTKADGTFRLEPTESKVYIYASKFSVYAIGYTRIPESHTVTVRTDGRGAAEASPTTAEPGTTVILTATPDPGFRLVGWEVLEGGVTVTDDSFTMPDRDVTVQAVFEPTSAPTGVPYHSILASATEGGTISPAGRTRVRRGRSATVTITPDEGFVIADVLVDRKSVGAVGEYTFEKIATGHSIQAVFTKQTACPRDASCPIHPFTDAKPAAWYHDGVHFCLERGLMQGYGRGLFGPGDTLTRAQLARILYNQAGKPAVSGNAPFDDVSPDAWYAPAVAWAAETGIVEGYGDGNFGPADAITREQLAAMLYRYANRQGSVLTGTLSAGFPDKDAVSPWAREAMGAMTASGVIRGKEDQRLDPQGRATRAEAATMLQRFCALTRVFGPRAATAAGPEG